MVMDDLVLVKKGEVFVIGLGMGPGVVWGGESKIVVVKAAKEPMDIGKVIPALEPKKGLGRWWKEKGSGGLIFGVVVGVGGLGVRVGVFTNTLCLFFTIFNHRNRSLV